MIEVGLEVFVAAAGEVDYNDIVGPEFPYVESRQCVRRLQRGNDAFESCQAVSRGKRLGVGGGEHFGPA